MTVSQSQVTDALLDLVDLIGTEHDPLDRLRLIAVTSTFMDQTLGPATDKALYEARLVLPTIDDVVFASGWKRWQVKAAIRRHSERQHLPLPYLDRGPLDYVPIV
jgi:hypothetical protein